MVRFCVFSVEKLYEKYTMADFRTIFVKYERTSPLNKFKTLYAVPDIFGLIVTIRQYGIGIGYEMLCCTHPVTRH